MLRESTLALEGPLRVSKALKIPLLLDFAEMRSLLSDLPPFALYRAHEVVTKEEAMLSKESFLECYGAYVEALKAGRIPSPELTRSAFSTLWSRTEEAIYQIPLSGGRCILKACLPVLQLQPHFFRFSAEDGEFRSQVFGPESVSWGIHFSYPQFFQDNRTQEILPVDLSARFPNTELFRALQGWVRHHTRTTPFCVEGKRVNVPIRLGKGCLPWIGGHAGLKGILIAS